MHPSSGIIPITDASLRCSLKRKSKVPRILPGNPACYQRDTQRRARRQAVQNLKIDGFDPLSFLTSVGTGTSTSQYPSGKMVFRQGDPARSLFYVQQGLVQISIISDQGREGVTAIHGPGELFGQESLTHQGIHRTNAVTIGLSAIAKIDNRALIRVLKADPSTAIMFLSFLLWRNVQIE